MEPSGAGHGVPLRNRPTECVGSRAGVGPPGSIERRASVPVNQAAMGWSVMMEEKQDQKNQWIEIGVKLALSLAVLFPVYAFLYVTFPISIVGFYLISAVVFALFAPWDDFKKKFMS